MSARLTELDALNTILSTIGSSPITNLTDPQNADAITARNILINSIKKVQSEKWYFNTEDNYPLTPDNTQRIQIPRNLIAVDYIGRFGEKVDAIVRGDYLYDRTNHTYTFADTLTANVQWCLTFDELPETAKQYVVAIAARQFQEQMLGDPHLQTWTRADEASARAKLLDEDLCQRKLSFGALPKLDPSVKMDFRDL